MKREMEPIPAKKANAAVYRNAAINAENLTQSAMHSLP